MSEPHASSIPAVASRIHTIGLLVMIAGWTCAGTIMAAMLRSHSGPPLSVFLLAALMQEWLILLYVVAGVRRKGGSLRELIGGSWKSGRDFWRDVLVAFVFWVVAVLCLGALRWALHVNRSADSLRFLMPQSGLEIALWAFLSLTAGFCEETIFRGYLQRQFLALTGRPFWGILLAAAVFGTAHLYQGARLALLVGIFGAMFGMLAYRRRSLRPGIMAHAWHDTIFGLAAHFLPK